MALRLEMAFGGTADTWLKMQVNFDLARARKRVAAARIKSFARRVA
ncbi:MAG: helix-turn-helix transcriptional regulator [Rhodospirillales bacterium]